LVEPAQSVFDQDEAERLQKKLSRNEFNFEDFYSQLQQIKKMGNLKDLMGMIPGIGKAMKDVDVSDDSFKHIEAIIQSMTPHERQHPDVMNGSRRKRIAMGAGRDIQDVNQLIKQFEDMRKMMKTMNKLQGAGRSMKGLPFRR
jgi:signal recognition particle subunit SRP54